jgi:hypothetical protein
MKKFTGNRQEIIFWTAAISLFLCVIGYTIFTFSFLARKIDAALFQAPPRDSLIIHFDFDKLNQVLAKKPGTTP